MNTEVSPPENIYIYFFNLTCEYDFGAPGFGKFYSVNHQKVDLSVHSLM